MPTEPVAPEQLRDVRSRAHALAEDLLAKATDRPHHEGVAERLSSSVIRPLDAVLVDGDGSAPRDGRELAQELRALAIGATRLGAEQVATEVREAIAALQDLACQLAPPDGLDDLLAELRSSQAGVPSGVQVAVNGPYLVTNAENLRNWLGEAIPPRPTMALCRCGASDLKPFCDGTHARIGFTDAKDPKRVPDRRDTYVGQQVTILDNRGICQHSGFCTDRLASVFHLGEEPFVTPSGVRGPGARPRPLADAVRVVRRAAGAHPDDAPVLREVRAGGSAARTAVRQHVRRPPPARRPVAGRGLRGPEAIQRGARRLPAHALPARGQGPHRGAPRALGRAHNPVGAGGGPSGRPRVPLSVQRYIEWGSRLALENSQPGARPPDSMPMPRWDWGTAGPARSRVSALATDAEDDPPVSLPADDEPVRFEKHKILERVRNGSMPCDGAWPAERVDALERWVATGMSG